MPPNLLARTPGDLKILATTRKFTSTSLFADGGQSGAERKGKHHHHHLLLLLYYYYYYYYIYYYYYYYYYVPAPAYLQMVSKAAPREKGNMRHEE